MPSLYVTVVEGACGKNRRAMDNGKNHPHGRDVDSAGNVMDGSRDSFSGVIRCQAGN